MVLSWVFNGFYWFFGESFVAMRLVGVLVKFRWVFEGFSVFRASF